MTDPKRETASDPVPKLRTGIPGFDVITRGGLPRARATLVAGTAGSAKTLFATQFLAEGIEDDDGTGVFVTFEDPPDAVRANMRSFGWDIPRWEEEGRWRFVDASPDPESPSMLVGDFDLSPLLARIVNAVEKTGAKRVSLDSLNALFVQLPDDAVLRAELFRITHSLKERGATVVFTGERTREYGPITRNGTEEFVADNVVILRNHLVDERRRRTLEVLKLRGAPHQRGEFPFTITDEGMQVLPLPGQELTQGSSTVRVPSGIPELDEMCGGGFFRDSVILVSGATGTGKTLTTTEFLEGGFEHGDRCLLFAFEESREQLFRNAAGWGIDFAGMERDGRLRVDTAYPHAMAIEDHLVRMQHAIEEFGPQRVAVDSLSALERTAPLRGFREFVISLTSFLKEREIPAMFTSTTPTLAGGASVTEKHISTLTDTIILLRYVEVRGAMERGLTVLKMRGSPHDTQVRAYSIDGGGMHIGERFEHLTGILGAGRVGGSGVDAGDLAS